MQYVRSVETFEIPLCKFKKAELSICENIKFMKHIWSILWYAMKFFWIQSTDGAENQKMH